MKILLHTANLGSIDKTWEHEQQSIPHDYHIFNDTNFPPRSKAMSSRMQARLPKCFAWQFKPGYDFYMWLDGNLTLSHENSLKHFQDELEGHDIVALRHNRRPNIRQETRYMRKCINQESRYFVQRYEGEWGAEQYKAVQADANYVDDTLLNSGAFMYRNTPKVQAALKEWWYWISRYHIEDQVGFIYALKSAGLKIKILEDLFTDCWYLENHRHGHTA